MEFWVSWSCFWWISQSTFPKTYVRSNQICPNSENFVFELESSRTNSMGVPSSLDNILARGVSRPHACKSKTFVTKRVLEFKVKDDWTMVWMYNGEISKGIKGINIDPLHANLSLTKSPSSLYSSNCIFFPETANSHSSKSDINCWNNFAPVILPWLEKNLSSLVRIWLKSPM